MRCNDLGRGNCGIGSYAGAESDDCRGGNAKLSQLRGEPHDYGRDNHQVESIGAMKSIHNNIERR